MPNESIAVIGLGYVGLPLAVALSRRGEVVGFDVDARRIEELGRGIDRTNEVPLSDLQRSSLTITADPALLAGRTIYIVTVPTPIDEANRPDFTAMLKACEIVGPSFHLAPSSFLRAPFTRALPRMSAARHWRGRRG